jgi:hypothetical protein
MSRVLNIRATEAELAERCAKLGIGVSVIEPLASTGTRIVLSSDEGAMALRRAMAKSVIDTPVTRSSAHVSRIQKSYS